MSDYFPPFLPFMLICVSYGFLVIQLCLWIGNRYPQNLILSWLANTGRMTLTHYVSHTTIGMVVLEMASGRDYTGLLTKDPLPATTIILFAILYFLISIILSNLWLKYFDNGPFETFMRKISN